MIGFLLWYISVGVAIYTCFLVEDALNGFRKFKDSDYKSILRGLLVILVWPMLPKMMNYD